MKALGSTEHQQATTAFAHKLLDKRQLVAVEKFSFDIVEDYGIEPEKFLRILRKAGSQFVLIFGVQPDDHRLVVLFRFFVGFCFETSEQRVAGLAISTTEIELGFPLRHANHSDEIDLVILFDGTSQEFELPVRSPTNIKNTVLR